MYSHEIRKSTYISEFRTERVVLCREPLDLNTVCNKYAINLIFSANYLRVSITQKWCNVSIPKSVTGKPTATWEMALRLVLKQVGNWGSKFAILNGSANQHKHILTSSKRTKRLEAKPLDFLRCLRCSVVSSSGTDDWGKRSPVLGVSFQSLGSDTSSD